MRRTKNPYADIAGHRWSDDDETQAALAARGVFLLHGSAFRLGGHKILAVGPTGSGKSTLVAAVLASGGQVVSDDMLALSLEGEIAVVHRWRPYLSFRQSGVDIIRRGAGAGVIDLTHHEATGRGLYALRDADDAISLQEIVPTVLCRVEVDHGDGPTRRGVISQAEMLAALLYSSSGRIVVGNDGTLNRGFLECATRLFRQCSVWGLVLGHDLLSVPEKTLGRVFDLSAR